MLGNVSVLLITRLTRLYATVTESSTGRATGRTHYQPTGCQLLTY